MWAINSAMWYAHQLTPPTNQHPLPAWELPFPRFLGEGSGSVDYGSSSGTSTTRRAAALNEKGREEGGTNYRGGGGGVLHVAHREGT